MANLTQTGLTVAVFASDKGPGDAERASLMGEVGRVFARKGARILCLAEKGVIPVPLITAARTAGGAVEVVADASIVLPQALEGVPIKVLPDMAERQAYLANASVAFVALPGSLASATALFGAWASGMGKPVVMLNRHRAFEVIRGFASDVLSASVANYDRNIQFADTVEDLWSKVVWVSEQRR
jgi:predicted Rossmann-fold nucleotide-binding protein